MRWNDFELLNDWSLLRQHKLALSYCDFRRIADPVGATLYHEFPLALLKALKDTLWHVDSVLLGQLVIAKANFAVA